MEMLTPKEWLQWFEEQDYDMKLEVLHAMVLLGAKGHEAPMACHIVYWAAQGTLASMLPPNGKVH
jgi:hypothetical protein